MSKHNRSQPLIAAGQQRTITEAQLPKPSPPLEPQRTRAAPGEKSAWSLTKTRASSDD